MAETGIQDERIMMRRICSILQEADEPLSRLDISRALEPDVVAELRLYIEKMLKLGILRIKMMGAAGTTTVNRYELAEGVDCSKIEAD